MAVMMFNERLCMMNSEIISTLQYAMRRIMCLKFVAFSLYDSLTNKILACFQRIRLKAFI